MGFQTNDEYRKRRKDAVALRLAGSTFREITEALGYSTIQNCHKDYKKGLDELGIVADEDKAELELMRLDALQKAQWRKAMQGDPKAARLALEIIRERRLRETPAVAPVVVEVSEAKVSGYDEIAARRAARLANADPSVGATG